MNATIIILLVVGSLARTFYRLAVQERSAITCCFRSRTSEEDEEESQPLHLNECYR